MSEGPEAAKVREESKNEENESKKKMGVWEKKQMEKTKGNYSGKWSGRGKRLWNGGGSEERKIVVEGKKYVKSRQGHRKIQEWSGVGEQTAGI